MDQKRCPSKIKNEETVLLTVGRSVDIIQTIGLRERERSLIDGRNKSHDPLDSAAQHARPSPVPILIDRLAPTFGTADGPTDGMSE